MPAFAGGKAGVDGFCIVAGPTGTFGLRAETGCGRRGNLVAAAGLWAHFTPLCQLS